MPTLLSQLEQYSTVVADTGDLQAVRRFAPHDATTNPSLVLKAVVSGHYDTLLDDLCALAKAAGLPHAQAIDQLSDQLIVALGCDLLQHVPGRVSSEVDARLSFDKQASLAKARRLVALYEAAGVPRERFLIKLAATWEGIRAASELEREGIQCNLTLIFNLAQALACAEAGAFLISPFVGRVLDWHRRAYPDREYAPASEPGVQLVAASYRFMRRHGYATSVMGASFRNVGEIVALAGCDRLTISPALLEELAVTEGSLQAALAATADHQAPPPPLSEADFRWQMNEDAMATAQLAEGIRGFAADQSKLEALIAQRLWA